MNLRPDDIARWDNVGFPPLEDPEATSKVFADPDDDFDEQGEGGGDAERQEPWANPVQFNDYDLPDFPVEALPEPLASFARDVAIATQTPVDMAAMLGLATAAAAIGTKAQINPGPDWFEPLCVFVAVVLPPGNRKSAVFRKLTEVVSSWEHNKAEEMAPQIAVAVSERKALEARHEHLLKQSARADDPLTSGDLRAQAADLAKEIEGLKVPVAPSIIVDDITQEAVAAAMYEQGGGLAVMSPEGGGPFALMGGRYTTGGAPSFEVYLKGHAGDAIRVHRRNRAPLVVHRPALVMGLTLQPEALEAIADIPGARGRGLLARFFYSIPRSTVGRRDSCPPPVPRSSQAAWDTRILELLKMERGSDARVVALSHEAKEALVLFMRELEPKLAASGRLGGVADWASKLTGLVVRVAGIMHALTHGAGFVEAPLSVTTLRNAFAVGEYATAHAVAAHAEMGSDPNAAAARWLLDHIKRRCGVSFSARTLWLQISRGRFQKMENLEAALRVLVERGFLRVKSAPEKKAAGRPKSPEYEAHPSLCEGFEDSEDIEANTREQKSTKGVGE